MKITKISIKNFNSIKDSGDIIFSDNLFVLAGQNESGKSSILEALKAYEDEDFKKDTLNFEEEQSKNLKQEVSCVYAITDKENAFIYNLIDTIKEEFSIEEEDFIDQEKLRKIKKYTITKIFDHASNSLLIQVNHTLLNILKSAIKKEEKVETDNTGEEKKTSISYLDIDGNKEKIAKIFLSISPEIILFNDFKDVLPDKILISDLENKKEKAKGYKAVKNIEKLMNKSFVDISKSSTVAQKSSITSKEVQNISVTFQKDWKQKIYGNNEVKIIFHIKNENINSQAVSTVFFYVQTKDNVPLEPRKRSKGMIWFLSAWIDLKARENDGNLIILYDEPGLYLHIKAQKDILRVFNSLVKKGHQIIYSTHSSSLIDANSLYNIGLVLNIEKDGTIVEGLTTSKINTEYKQDALQPIAEAMGLEPLGDFSVLSRKNVLLEGLSDFWYFQAMTKIFDKKIDYKFVPGIGIKGNHIYHLISFCIGYGLEWLLVMDNGTNPRNTRNDLREKVFNNDEAATNQKIKLIDFDEVENMFSVKDLNLVDERIKADDKRKPVSIIGKGRKIIFAKNFFQKVDLKVITKDKLDKKTVRNFKKIFEWIDSEFINKN